MVSGSSISDHSKVVGDFSPKKSKLSKASTKVGLRTSEGSNSIQENPNLSKTYKSLFTTSEEAKNQVKPHWITFNPLYFR